MTAAPRRARVDALAKINLGLKVLHKRPDGFHELRTVYQTISLSDSIDVEFAPARRTSIEMAAGPHIPGNLVVRAAQAVMDQMRTTGRVSFRLRKRIPMGAGLGGGSSDAAAVLLTLPVLAGRPIALDALIQLAGELGSDVPFFLLGGAALGIGRGSEVYPLPDLPRTRGLLVAPPLHVSTADAYRSLRRSLTSHAAGNTINSFQSCIWLAGVGVSKKALAENDFEPAVLRRYPTLKPVKARLLQHGADQASLTGSGSALFGIFGTREKLESALYSFRGERVFPFAFVSRRSYRARWWRRLRAHMSEELWPPQSSNAS